MCGRYSLGVAEINDVRIRFRAEFFKDIEWRARFNVAPSQDAPVIFLEQGKRLIQLMRWGLVPYWSKDPKIGYKMINARMESLREKPSYREAFARRRCIIPADGFYEWKVTGPKSKVPLRIVRREGDPYLALAGLWEKWKSPEGELRSFTIITTACNDLLQPIHDRMPAMIEGREAEDAWLSPETSLDEAYALLKPASEDRLRVYPVSKLVNSPQNDSPELIEAVKEGAL